MIIPQWLELPMSRTSFHGPKDVRANEIRLYICSYFWKAADSNQPAYSRRLIVIKCACNPKFPASERKKNKKKNYIASGLLCFRHLSESRFFFFFFCFFFFFFCSVLYTEVNLQILSWFNAKTFVVTTYLCTESFILVIRLQKSNTDTFSSSENESKLCQNL